jgi:hypothetical protein
MVNNFKTVYKWPIPMQERTFTLDLPKGWKFLSLMLQGDRPHVWLEVQDGIAREEFDFGLYGTGHEIPLSATYLASFQFGPFVFHLYRLK